VDSASSQLDEVKELARLFEIQAERINRLVERDRAGDPVPYFSREIEAATKLLIANYRIKEALGLVGPPAQEDAMAKLQFTKYSQRTVEVLSNPESRHRIMSLLERVVRYGKGSPEIVARLEEMKKGMPINGKALPALDLPLPQSEVPAIVVEPGEEEKTPGDG
jgi:hypothetical protein